MLCASLAFPKTQSAGRLVDGSALPWPRAASPPALDQVTTAKPFPHFIAWNLSGNLFWFQLYSWYKFRLIPSLSLEFIQISVSNALAIHVCSPSAGVSQPSLLPQDVCWDKTARSKLGRELMLFVNLCSLHFLILGNATVLQVSKPIVYPK